MCSFTLNFHLCFNSKCLKNHKAAVHTSYKPYECMYCSHTTARKAMMDLHIRTHTGEKPFKLVFFPHFLLLYIYKLSNSFQHGLNIWWKRKYYTNSYSTLLISLQKRDKFHAFGKSCKAARDDISWLGKNFIFCHGFSPSRISASYTWPATHKAASLKAADQTTNCHKQT